MAYIGQHFIQFTRIEIDEQGRVWQVVNNVSNQSIIEEFDAAANGYCIVEIAPEEDEYLEE
jgi:hypothetical protein